MNDAEHRGRAVRTGEGDRDPPPPSTFDRRSAPDLYGVHTITTAWVRFAVAGVQNGAAFLYQHW